MPSLHSAMLALLLCVCAALSAAAQKPARYAAIEPRVFGFDIPNGRVRPGEDRRVIAREEDGIGVVAKVYVEVGDHLILLLPDGRLIARHVGETQGTTRPFTAATKDSLAATLVADTYPGFRLRQTKHYLYVYNTSEAFATLASRLMESMFPGVVAYVESQGIDTKRPDLPLIVVMFKDEQEYRRYSNAPKGAIAHYSILSNRVMMYEKTGLEAVRPDLAAQQAVSTIAHEGAHQILANTGVQERLSWWPMWVSEGMAEFFSPTSTDGKFKWKGAAQINDLRMFELELYLARKGFVPDGKSVTDIVEASRLTSTGYAASWALVHFLSQTQRQQFNGYVKQLSALGPLEGNLEFDSPRTTANRTLFEKQFGAEFPELEKKLLIHLKNQPYTRPLGG